LWFEIEREKAVEIVRTMQSVKREREALEVMAADFLGREGRYMGYLKKQRSEDFLEKRRLIKFACSSWPHEKRNTISKIPFSQL